MNIAASILLNGDMLEDVKRQSETLYEGSADTELAKYLDSIEGKLSKLQNRIQELAATTIKSDWIKNTVDLMASGVGVINKITKSVGGLTTALGLAIAAMTTFQNNGFIAKDKSTNKLQLGSLGNTVKEFGSLIGTGAKTGYQVIKGKITNTPVQLSNPVNVLNE